MQRLNEIRNKLNLTLERAVLVFLAVCIFGQVSWGLLGPHDATAARTAAKKTGIASAVTKVDSLKERQTNDTSPILVASASKLLQTFDNIDYRLNDVMFGQGQVPRLFLVRLPPDLETLRSVSQRKALFIKSILPLILHVNEQIEIDRLRIKKIKLRLLQGKRLKLDDHAWLQEKTQLYKMELFDFEELLLRHDIVPPSLALAQAIIESGWGTSRFARYGNAVFGQWTFKNGAGIVPRQRADGKQHEVKTFKHLEESVKQYVTNLNRHNAYREFRNQRAKMRLEAKKIEGYILARTMKRYSERGKLYIQSLQLIMNSNSLENFDLVRLRQQKSG